MATGIGNLPYLMPSVSPFDVITSQAENERIANIESLADGTGIGDGVITNAKLSTTAGEPGGAWKAWTPTWTGLTIGNATVTARYSQVGKNITVRVTAILGSTSSVTGPVSISLPVTAASYPGTSAIPPLGTAVYWNSSIAPVGSVIWESTTLARLYVYGAGSTYVVPTALTNTVPFTWAATHEIQLSFTYEAA